MVSLHLPNADFVFSYFNLGKKIKNLSTLDWWNDQRIEKKIIQWSIVCLYGLFFWRIFVVIICQIESINNWMTKYLLNQFFLVPCWLQPWLMDSSGQGASSSISFQEFFLWVLVFCFIFNHLIDCQCWMLDNQGGCLFAFKIYSQFCVFAFNSAKRKCQIWKNKFKFLKFVRIWPITKKKPESQKIAHAQIELVKFCPYQQTLNKNKQKERKGKNVAEILA